MAVNAFDEAFRNWLDKLNEEYSKSDDEIVSMTQDEIVHREQSNSAIRKYLTSGKIDKTNFSKEINKSWAMAGRFPQSDFNDFIKDSRSNAILNSLIQDFPEENNEARNKINNFINALGSAGFKNKSNAALLTSVILTSIHPSRFVDFRQNRWESFAEALGEDFPSKDDYGTRIIRAGNFARNLSETETFHKMWGKHNHPNWAISGICWKFRDKRDEKMNRELAEQNKARKSRLEELKDDKEQEELENLVEDDREKLKEILKMEMNKKTQSPEIVSYNGRRYKRSNAVVVALKIFRNYKCQRCGITIPKKNGSYYIEGAHIESKSKGGSEKPDNIMILCPNHHKEFDKGSWKKISKNENEFVFELNDNIWKIDLSLA